jgi:hypothetical protein
MVKKTGSDEVPGQVGPAEVGPEQVEPEQATAAHPETATLVENARMPAWGWALIGAMAATIVLGGAFIVLSANKGTPTVGSIQSEETSGTAGEASATLAMEDTPTADAGADPADSGDGTSNQGSGSDPAPAAPAPAQPMQPAQPVQPAAPNPHFPQPMPSIAWTILAKQSIVSGAWSSGKLDPGNGKLLITVKILDGDAGSFLVLRKTPLVSSPEVWIGAHQAGDPATSWKKEYAIEAGQPWWVILAPGDGHTPYEITIGFKATP